jgi:hypothetical protein
LVEPSAIGGEVLEDGWLGLDARHPTLKKVYQLQKKNKEADVIFTFVKAQTALTVERCRRYFLD